MKAVLCTKYGSPDVLQIAEVEKPVPNELEILVKIKATTVTVADTRTRSFNIPLGFWIPARLILGILKPKKAILGVELAGVVEQVGHKVKKFKKGDKIVAARLKEFGAYAEYICLPESSTVAFMPKNVTFAEATAIPIGARTALHYLKKVKIRPSHKVLIYGASGSVGTYAIQLAKYYGAEVTGVCSASNFELILSLGAIKVFDYQESNWMTKLTKYDVIFVAVDKWPFSKASKFLTPTGTLINITTPIKSLSMYWATLTTKKRILIGESSPESAKGLQFLIDLVEKKKLKTIIDREFNLSQIVEAHKYVDKGHKKGNVVISLK